MVQQRMDRPLLDVRETFETTRFGPQCLVETDTRLVPVRRKALRRPGTEDLQPVATADRRQGGEHV